MSRAVSPSAARVYGLALVTRCWKVLILLLILLLCAAPLARAEGLSFGYAIYFTAVTALTVGYGDITPTTTIGRVVGVVGVICVGIVVAVAARALERVVADKMD